jgi:hypothetical protein
MLERLQQSNEVFVVSERFEMIQHLLFLVPVFLEFIAVRSLQDKSRVWVLRVALSPVSYDRALR